MAKVKKVLKFVFLVLLVLFAFRSCSFAAVVQTSFTGNGKQILDNTFDAGFTNASNIYGNSTAYNLFLSICDDMESYSCIYIELEAQTFFPQKRYYRVYLGNSYSQNYDPSTR